MSLRPSTATEGFGQAILILCIGLSICPRAAASAQESSLAICHASSGQKEFVQRSLQIVKEGVPREDVLDELACVYSNRAVESEVRAGAMMALFHIAHDDATIRRYLIAFIEQRGQTGAECDEFACGLLKYVADAEARRVLLEQVTKRWPKPFACYTAFSVLLDLGDPRFLKWLEGVLDKMAPDDPRRSFFEEQARFVRAQRSVDDLLEYFKREMRYGVGDGQVINAAIRFGATCDQLRAAYWGKIRQCENDLQHKETCRMNVKNAVRRGLFDATDIDLLPDHLKTPLHFPESDLDGSTWPGWAQLYEKKRNEFWKGYRCERQED